MEITLTGAHRYGDGFEFKVFWGQYSAGGPDGSGGLMIAGRASQRCTAAARGCG